MNELLNGTYSLSLGGCAPDPGYVPVVEKARWFAILRRIVMFCCCCSGCVVLVITTAGGCARLSVAIVR